MRERLKPQGELWESCMGWLREVGIGLGKPGFFFFFSLFLKTVSLCSPVWPQILYLTASASRITGMHHYTQSEKSGLRLQFSYMPTQTV
jgi:hypothetical protein